jgi:chromosome segregation ATPase
MGRLADFVREQNITLAGQQKQKMLSLDAQFEKMEAERDSLKTENQNLKAQVNPLQRENERLKQRIEEAGTKRISESGKDHLDESDISILKLVAAAELRDEISPSKNDIAKFLKVNPIRAEVLLGRLVEKRYIYFNQRTSGYDLAPDGKTYLVKNNIL